ncbi:Ig-like domain-containing protein [Pontibacter cellulosilyticus]|uniref:T9SS type A sorting domain-containing protein n=1 Tax=Pontibacter cellulosilyticus TaxID=1720253 RepID=A0A923N697_9BACT|nr:T9SS type A sorting domain-containing protein [Pontibacter cellulosilyticus]MBC5993006.1 T9SS type A sorting domain-containing protein [Pontibacter cellulosilyticus]
MNKFSCYTSRTGNVLSQQLQLVWRIAMVVVVAFLFSGNAYGQIPASYCDGNPAGWPLSGPGTAKITDKFNSNVDDQFTEGSKDGNQINQNAWALGTANDKGDIINAGAALVDGCVLRFFADRYAVNGDAAIGFWFYKDPNISLNPDGTFSGTHTDGDILIVVNFVNGGGTAAPVTYIWSSGSLVETSVQGCGITNTTQMDVPSGLSYQSKSGPAGKYQAGAFFEGYVNLCGSGIDLCFSRFLVETRNSQSLTASLQDFALGSIDIKPAIPQGTATDETCLVKGTVTVTSPIVGLSYKLSGNGFNQTIVATAGNPVVFTGLEDGTYSLTAINTASNCESGARSIEVDADITPVNAPGALDVDRCGPGTVTLAVSNPLGGVTYRWYATQTSTTILHTGTTFTTPSLNATEDYWISATGANGCPSTRTSVQAIIQTPVVVEAGDNLARCQSASAQVVPLTGASITGGATTGTWTIVSSVPANAGNTLGNNTLASGSLTVAANYVGVITLQLTSADPPGACPFVSDTRTVSIGPAAVVDAGDNLVRCQSASAQAVALTGASVTGGAATGTWTIVSSVPANAGNVLGNNTLASGSLTVAANYVGVITLQLTSADPDGAGPCVAVSDTRTITINQAAIVDAGDNLTRCQSSSAQVIALTGASVTGGASTGTWEIVSSVPANAGNVLGNTTLAGGSLTVAANYTGVITLRLTSADPDGAGPCPAVSDTRTVTIGPAAVVEAGANLERCQLSTTQAIALTGATVSGGTNTGTWSIVSSNPVNAGNMLSNSTLGSGSLTVAANYVGVITLQLTSADPDGAGPCVAVSDTRTVTIYPAATANAGGPYTVGCTQPRQVTLMGTFGGGATSGSWSVPMGMGTVVGNVYTPSAAALEAGVPVTLTYTTNDPAGPCLAATATAIVNFEVCDVFEGCTLGYWKNHTGSWACYSPTTLYGSIFASAPDELKNMELLDVLNLGGGGIYNLARQSVAALLNACHPHVDYELTSSQIISRVNAAFAAGTKNAAGALATELDMMNNAGCSIDAHNRPISSSSSSSLQGIGEVEAGDLKAYPTPFSDKATIEFTTSVDESYTVRLYDMRGALVQELKSGEAKAGVVNQVEVDGRSLPEGLYLGRVVTGSGSQTVKLLLKR